MKISIAGMAFLIPWYYILQIHLVAFAFSLAFLAGFDILTQRIGVFFILQLAMYNLTLADFIGNCSLGMKGNSKIA